MGHNSHRNHTHRIFFKSIFRSINQSIILHLQGFLCIRDSGCRGKKITAYLTVLHNDASEFWLTINTVLIGLYYLKTRYCTYDAFNREVAKKKIYRLIYLASCFFYFVTSTSNSFLCFPEQFQPDK